MTVSGLQVFCLDAFGQWYRPLERAVADLTPEIVCFSGFLLLFAQTFDCMGIADDFNVNVFGLDTGEIGASYEIAVFDERLDGRPPHVLPFTGERPVEWPTAEPVTIEAEAVEQFIELAPKPVQITISSPSFK